MIKSFISNLKPFLSLKNEKQCNSLIELVFLLFRNWPEHFMVSWIQELYIRFLFWFSYSHMITFAFFVPTPCWRLPFPTSMQGVHKIIIDYHEIYNHFQTQKRNSSERELKMIIPIFSWPPNFIAHDLHKISCSNSILFFVTERLEIFSTCSYAQFYNLWIKGDPILQPR